MKHPIDVKGKKNILGISIVLNQSMKHTGQVRWTRNYKWAK